MICRYFVWFIIYSFMGWIYESAYCTLRTHKWQNRGFLHGPIVPIYGVGALGVSVLFTQLPAMPSDGIPDWQVFLICMAGSAVLEYFTSWALEKLFHAYWWDYSQVPLNINGRICLPASIGFGFAGLLVLHVIYPFVRNATVGIPDAATQILALAFMLIFGMDLSLTVSALTGFAKRLERIENEINEQIAQTYDNLEDKLDATREAMQERLRTQHLNAMLRDSNMSQKHAIRRVKGFRRKGNAKSLREHFMRMLDNEKRP